MYMYVLGAVPGRVTVGQKLSGAAVRWEHHPSTRTRWHPDSNQFILIHVNSPLIYY